MSHTYVHEIKEENIYIGIFKEKKNIVPFVQYKDMKIGICLLCCQAHCT